MRVIIIQLNMQCSVFQFAPSTKYFVQLVSNKLSEPSMAIFIQWL